MRIVHGTSLSRLVLLALALPYTAACSTTPALSLTASPGSIAGDGQSPVTISATLTRGGAVVDSGSVHFVATAGAFSDGSGTPVSPPLVLDVETASGIAPATLLAPRVGRGSITITATASVDGVALKQTATVALTPAGGLANSIQFHCDSQNIGALVSPRDAITVLCHAKAFDAQNREILNASIETMAEAGTLAWQIDQNNPGQQILVYTVQPGATPPVDVDPFDNTMPNPRPRQLCPSACANNSTACDAEPCWTDQSGIVHNPRDGVATLVVAVPAVAGDDSQGEPFVDVDDDGVRSATETQYLDVNGNGRYDGPTNQISSAARMVWKNARIVWSGSADSSSGGHGSYFEPHSVTGLNLNPGTLHVWDSNFNALAADGATNGDTIDISSNDCTNGDTFTLSGASLALKPSGGANAQPGILFCGDLNPNCSAGDIVGAGFPTTYRRGTDYTFHGSAANGKSTCSLGASINRSFDPGLPGNSSGQTATDLVTGSITFQ